eukprot:UN17477
MNWNELDCGSLTNECYSLNICPEHYGPAWNTAGASCSTDFLNSGAFTCAGTLADICGLIWYEDTPLADEATCECLLMLDASYVAETGECRSHASKTDTIIDMYAHWVSLLPPTTTLAPRPETTTMEPEPSETSSKHSSYT